MANWFFGLCFAASVGATWFSLERMRSQVNLVLPSDRNIGWRPPRAQSFVQLFSKSHILAHYFKVLDQYREYYPSSFLPKTLAIALAGGFVSFIGTIVSGMIY